MSERVANVITKQGTDISDLINRVADAHSMPPQLLLAQAISESNLDEYARRPQDPADDQSYWPDVSGGLWQQTVRYACGYGLGDCTSSESNISEVMGVLMTDLEQAADIAAQQLGYWWAKYGDPLEAMGRYNWPGLGYQGNPNAANISRGWDESAAYVVDGDGKTTTQDPRRTMLIDKCHEYAGMAYVWAGKAPPPDGPGFDCSGLVTYCAEAVGLGLGTPYYTSAQGIKQYCRPVDLDNEPALPGDIITFKHTYDGEGENATHVGVWVSPGVMIDTHMGPGVGFTNIYGDYWQDPYHWDGLYRPLGYDDTGAIQPPVPEPEPEPEPVPPSTDAQRVAELESQLGYLTHDVADAQQAALDGMRAATESPTAEQNAALDAMQAAINTLRRGGA